MSSCCFPCVCPSALPLVWDLSEFWKLSCSRKPSPAIRTDTKLQSLSKTLFVKWKLWQQWTSLSLSAKKHSNREAGRLKKRFAVYSTPARVSVTVMVFSSGDTHSGVMLDGSNVHFLPSNKHIITGLLNMFLFLIHAQ